MKKFLLLFVIFLASCTKTVDTPVNPTIPSEPVTSPQPKPPTPTPQPTPPSPTIDYDAILKANPSCSRYSWKDRSIAPTGYLKGVMMSYARSYCRYNVKSKTPASVMVQPLGDEQVDALSLYKLGSTSDLQRLKQNYTLLIGLGMRESSGWYGEGRDMSADWTASNTAESGLFQFSYNLKDFMAQNSKDALASLYSEYQSADENKCLVKTFIEGKNPNKKFNTKYWSLDTENPAAREAGLKFQKISRECPAFATEYAAVGIRSRLKHWGPLKRKEAEYNKACEQMLTQVEQSIKCD